MKHLYLYKYLSCFLSGPLTINRGLVLINEESECFDNSCQMIEKNSIHLLIEFLLAPMVGPGSGVRLLVAH